MIELEMNQAFN